nr:ABC transporter permease [uncultured Niameybacter sp.]
MHKVKDWFLHNSVILLFTILCIGGIAVSGQPLSFVLDELMLRIARNSFLVLALIIPIIAGMGLNFGIVMGAMAGQIALLMVIDWGMTGIVGFIVAVLISTPFAILFGYLIGLLLNKTKGQEMITGMIAGYFSNGLYQLLFLFLIGAVIPLKTANLLVSTGVGVKNTLDLNENMKYALDGLWKMPFPKTLLFFLILLIAVNIIKMAYKAIRFKTFDKKDLLKPAIYIGIILLQEIVLQNEMMSFTLNYITVPVATMIVIGFLCVFNNFILKTKLGQDFRTVGQNMHVANAAGINVDKVRIKAIIISTVLAAWGQLIFLQNIGTLNTYGSHEQVGMFASAAILIGGATITRATNKEALLGVVLFHTLFIVSPQAGQHLFNNAQIGEYFRVFVAYAVICVSLALYAWKHVQASRKA